MKRIAMLSSLLAAGLVSWSCTSTAGNLAHYENRSAQTDQEIDRIMGRLTPSERFVPHADSKLLWQATQGYMERAFPLDELPAAVNAGGPRGSTQLRSKLVEWVGEGLPHRTRVFVEIRPDPSNAANMRVRAVALMIEAEPQLEGAQPDRPLEYDWKLLGNNQRVEETVLDQIMRRYLALVEGKALPLDDELVLPMKPAGS